MIAGTRSTHVPAPGGVQRSKAKVIARNARVQSGGTGKDAYPDFEVSSPALQTNCGYLPHLRRSSKNIKSSAGHLSIDWLAVADAPERMFWAHRIALSRLT
jgi:hypothetical protein